MIEVDGGSNNLKLSFLGNQKNNSSMSGISDFMFSVNFIL